jgi:hypothetical protein
MQKRALLTLRLYSAEHQQKGEQDRQCTHDVALWRVRVTIAAMEKQQCVLCVQLSYMSLSTIEKYQVLHNNTFRAHLCRQQQ